RMRARQTFALRGTHPPTASATIAELGGALLQSAEAPADRLDVAVVGVPGVVDPLRGAVSLATNVPGIEGHRFADELRGLLGVPVRVENDINLAALGERWRGIARGVDDFLFLSIGTGLGAGLVLRGELHRGHHGAAGELDYVSAGLDEDIDPSGVAVASLAERAATRDGRRSAL